MKSMRLELGYDDGSVPPFVAAISETPDLDRELVLGGQTVGGVETVTSYVYGEPTAYASLLADRPGVLNHEITPAEDGFFAYVRRELDAEGRSLVRAFDRETVVLVPPMEVRSDRTIRMTVVGHADDLGTVLDELDAGVSADVRWVRDGIAADRSRASDRQLAALQAAWDLGYYEVPRGAGIEAVADELDCAVSTASELIRRGEASVIGGVVDRGPTR